jgi:hypothetical protein
MQMFIAFLLCLACLSSARAEPVPEGKMVYDSRAPLLMVDRCLIDANEGTSLTVCEAARHPDNPILKRGGPGSPDETHAEFGGAVHYVDGRFRMWYMAHGAAGWATGYAESQDGIHWTKPNLGLQDYAGNRNNNLVDLGSRGFGGTVLYDPGDADPLRRYKIPISCTTRNGRQGIWTLAYSRDGLRWTVDERQAPMCGTEEDAELQNLFRSGDRYGILTQQVSSFVETRPGYSGRAAVLLYTDDPRLANWTKVPKAVWIIPEGNGPYEAHSGIAPWARPNLMIGLYGIFMNHPELEDSYTDLGLILSHDGTEWWEPCRLATLLRRGPAGSWDSKFLIQGQGFVNVGDQTFIYYSGNSSGNAGLTSDIGLATLRRDGFGFLAIHIGWTYATRQAPREAELTTAPIRLHEVNTEKVLLNVDNVSGETDRWLQVEILDDARRPLPGYSFDDADRVTAAGIAVPATWKGSASLARVGVPTIRLHIRFHGGRFRHESPRLYAVYFSPPRDIEQ